MSVLSIVVADAHHIISALPDPTPDAPPGGDKALKILNWLLWIVVLMCVGGIIAIGGLMVSSAVTDSGHGGGGRHTRALGVALAGCVIVGAASGIVAALI